MENISTLRAGVALAITLVVAFVLCAIARTILPDVRFSHMWLQLFSAAPAGTAAMWIEGVIASIVVGFITGRCFAHCYNWSGRHGIK